MTMGHIDLTAVNADLGRNAPALVQWALGLGKTSIVTTNFRPFEAVILHMVTQVNPDVPDQVVNSVPLAIALPAYISGQVGYYTTQLVEASFPMPIQYTQGQTSFNRPLFDLQKVLNARLQDSDLARNTDAYFMMCVFREVGLLRKNVGTLMNSQYLLDDFSVRNPALPASGRARATFV